MSSGITSIARRVSMVGVISLAVILLGMSAVMSIVLTKVAHDRVVSWVSDKTVTLIDAMNSMDDVAKTMVQQSFGTFRQEFGPVFQLDEATGDLRDWGPKLNGNFTQVDKFASTTGGTASAFALKDGSFARITSSLKTEKGERDTSPLDKNHAAFDRLMQGQAFAAREVLHGKVFMSYYDPIKSEAGKVIGVLAIALDMEGFQKAIDKMAADAKFFETGGTYVLSAPKDAKQARFVSHPTAKGKLAIESVPDIEKFLSDLDASSDGYVSSAPNALGASGSGYFAVGRKNKEAGFWVIAQVSNREAMSSHWATLVPFWLMLAAATGALGYGLFWMMRNWVAVPMAKLNHAVKSIAAGDLSCPVDSDHQDEVGALIRETEAMRLRLLDMIGTVRHSVDSIGTASAEIATGNQDLSIRTEQTASNLQIAASSMEQLTGTVRQTADSARTANQLVSSASSAANKGGQVVNQVVSTMTEINASSRKINDIIGVIDGIAFQTNILALNAAVEAARAGEQGRGFAVVAGEVRTLAQRSAEAAKEIKVLIGASVERVEIGTRLVHDAGTSMDEIVASVQRVSDIIGEISAAASEQSDGIVQVSESVAHLDQMTQQNAALVEESTAAAESLKDQAHKLVEAVAVFRLADGHRPAAAKASVHTGGAKKLGGMAVKAMGKPQADKTKQTPAKPTAKAEPAPTKPAADASKNDAHGEWESF